MKDATASIFKAVRTAILADSWIATRVADRVFSTYDNQSNISHPVIRMSIPDVRQFEMDEGGDGSEHDLYVNIYTSEGAPIVAKQIADRVRTALASPLVLDDADLVSLDYRDTKAMRDDQSPKLQMVVMRFLAITTTH